MTEKFRRLYAIGLVCFVAYFSSVRIVSADYYMDVAIFPDAKDLDMELSMSDRKITGQILRLSDGKKLADVTGTNDRLNGLTLTISSTDPSIPGGTASFDQRGMTDEELRAISPTFTSEDSQVSANIWHSQTQLGRLSRLIFCDDKCQFYRLHWPVVFHVGENAVGDKIDFEKALSWSEWWDIANGEIILESTTPTAKSNAGAENKSIVPSRDQIAKINSEVRKRGLPALSDCSKFDDSYICAAVLGLEDFEISIANSVPGIRASRNRKMRDSEIGTAAFPAGTWIAGEISPQNLSQKVGPIVIQMKEQMAKVGLQGTIVPEGIAKGLLFKADMMYRADTKLQDGSIIVPQLPGYWCRSIIEFGVTQHLEEKAGSIVDTLDMHVINTKVFRSPESHIPQLSEFVPLAVDEPKLESQDIDGDLNKMLLSTLAEQLKGVVVW